jgi:hypothetical protein
MLRHNNRNFDATAICYVCYNITRMWRACNLTAFIHSSTGPVVHPFASCHEGPRFNPKRGTYVLMWNRDSPVSVVSLHWRPRRDWSLWPRLRGASSRTVTRPLCRQCDNPTWSHTASVPVSRSLQVLLPASQLTQSAAGGEPCGELAISLHSYTVPLVQWSTWLLPGMRDLGLTPRGVFMWNRDSPVSVVSLHVHNFLTQDGNFGNLTYEVQHPRGAATPPGYSYFY